MPAGVERAMQSGDEGGVSDAIDEQEAPIGPTRRRRRGRWFAGGATGLLAIALATLWADREPIARNQIDRMLWQAGVDGSYRIARFGLTSQTIENLSLGDPAHPDLVAQRATIFIRYRFGWPAVTRIEAQGVRLRGRIEGGRLSLGSVDRLLPAGGGGPALPDVDLALHDGVVMLGTPIGDTTLSLAGEGNLADGFRGTIGISASQLALATCRLTGVDGRLAVSTAQGEPSLIGSIGGGDLRCPAAHIVAPKVQLDTTLAAALDGWRGSAGLTGRAIAAGRLSAGSAEGHIDFDGTTKATKGHVRAALIDAAVPGARAGRAAWDGGFTFAGGRVAAAGEVRLASASADGRALRSAAAAAAGSPAGPAIAALGDALTAAARGFAGYGRLSIAAGGALPMQMAIDETRLESRSGARVVVRPQPGRSVMRLDRSNMQLALTAVATGGGLPATEIGLSGDGSGFAGRADIAPFAGGGSRLALASLTFRRAAAGPLRFVTALTLDGPLGDGRVEGLTLPIEGEAAAAGLVVNRHCVSLGIRRLAIAGTVFAPASLPLCPLGSAMIAPGGGGVVVSGARARGQVGSAPLTLGLGRIEVALRRPGFVARHVSVRLGNGEDPTRLDLPRLDGQISPGGIAGHFDQASGRIGKVPLDLSAAAGNWRLAGGVLALDGGLTFADTAGPPRFLPMVSRDVRLRLAGGAITASGHLLEPKSGAEVATVDLRHDLRTGAGQARLGVEALRFDDHLQPEALTPLTLGLIANVQGMLTGEGRIGWDRQGVTSEGDFASDGIDLAAALGPVRGIKGKIHFSDLLALATPPGQSLTIAEINPGISVVDGVAHYQLLPGQRVKVESAHWPFSGGELVLEPTELDFGHPVERAMTFRVSAMDAAKFVQQFDFKNIAVTGDFDGSLPMIFDAKGGRIVGGRLAVRPGGGTLAYVGELSNAQLGRFGKLAFDALKSMRYTSLSIGLDGALDGDFVTKVSFDGTNQTPKAQQHGGLLGQFSNLPFRFRITIHAPFRGLLNSAASLNDPRGLIRQALPPRGDLPGTASSGVQPLVSDTKP